MFTTDFSLLDPFPWKKWDGNRTAHGTSWVTDGKIAIRTFHEWTFQEQEDMEMIFRKMESSDLKRVPPVSLEQMEKLVGTNESCLLGEATCDGWDYLPDWADTGDIETIVRFTGPDGLHTYVDADRFQLVRTLVKPDLWAVSGNAESSRVRTLLGYRDGDGRVMALMMPVRLSDEVWAYFEGPTKAEKTG